MCVPSQIGRVQLFATPWTAAHLAPLSMGFSRQEYWSGLPYLPPGDLPDPGTEPTASGLTWCFSAQVLDCSEATGWGAII